jgi:hypothetical protein
MLLNILIGVLMIVVTTVVHAGGMMLVLKVVRTQGDRWLERRQRTDVCWIGGIVVLMFFVSVVEAMLWAAAYLGLNAIEGFERAAYFSVVTFSTLGYGDIVLDERWRLPASFEAASGIIMFGWTTAIVIGAVEHIYFGKAIVHPRSVDTRAGRRS